MVNAKTAPFGGRFCVNFRGRNVFGVWWNKRPDMLIAAFLLFFVFLVSLIGVSGAFVCERW